MPAATISLCDAAVLGALKGCITRVGLSSQHSPSGSCLSSQPAPATAQPPLLTDMASAPDVLHLYFLQFSAHSSGPPCWGPSRAIKVTVGPLCTVVPVVTCTISPSIPGHFEALIRQEQGLEELIQRPAQAGPAH